MRFCMPYAHSVKLHLCPLAFMPTRICPLPSLLCVLTFSNLRIMQLSFVQSNLLWLFLPSLALAATPLAGQSVTGTSGQLKLVTPQGLNDSDVNRALYCKHNIPDPYDPDDPGWPPELYTTSLNRTLPATPPIDRAFMQRHGFVQNEGEVPFDCLFETLAGYLIFEVCWMRRLSEMQALWHLTRFLAAALLTDRLLPRRSRGKSGQISTWHTKSSSAWVLSTGWLGNTTAIS